MTWTRGEWEGLVKSTAQPAPCVGVGPGEWASHSCDPSRCALCPLWDKHLEAWQFPSHSDGRSDTILVGNVVSSFINNVCLYGHTSD